MSSLIRGLLAACAIVLLCAPPATAQYGYHFGRNKIQYEDFNWHILKTEHFDIYYYPEMQELAEYGAAFAEEVYDELENRFDLSLNHRVPIIFYSSNLHFKQTNVTSGFIPDGVGGFFEFLKGRVVVPSNGNIHRFKRVIRHELVHVFTYSKVLRVMRDHRQSPDRFLPLWFTEGLAEYWSGEPDPQSEMVMRDAVLSNILVPLENIYRITGTYLMYKEGEALFRFLSETYGEEKILLLIENFWKDKDFRRVLEVTLHEEFQVVNDRWLSWLHRKYYPILRESDVPTLIAGGVATRGFNMKPAFHRFPDGTRKIYYVANHTGYTNIYEQEVDSLYRPIGRPEVLIPGERSEQFEAFHLFESRIDVSRDGKLTFVTKSGGQDVIHVYDLEKGALGRTFSFPGLVAVYSPSWDPTGTKITFASIDKTGFSDLYVFDSAGGGLRKLTNDAYDDQDPSWSPDGRYIAFASDRTAYGEEFAYNLFTFDLEQDRIQYVTGGAHHDMSPRWSADGRYLVYTSSRRDSTGKYGAQNVWAVEMAAPRTVAMASAGIAASEWRPERAGRRSFRLTDLTTAVFDPVWTVDDRLVFTGFEQFRFTIRQLGGADSLLAAAPVEVQEYPASREPWAFERLGKSDGVQKLPYRKKYNLDVAQSQVSTNPIWGTTGGAFVTFSDMLGDDQWYLTLYNTTSTQQEFLKSINFAVSRVQLQGRANTAYGIYRFGGYRYDITDPDAASTFPIFWETMWGGFGAVSYPISMFRRVELNSSLNWSDKDVYIRDYRRRALLLSNMVSLVHDNALYGMNGPEDGWRANLSLAYTTDIRYSNVSYYTASTDVRRYFRVAPQVTFASRAMARLNAGREARLFVIGGSWDLRGYPLFGVRGRKMWFTSHELRFPLVNAPSVFLPILAPLGVVNLKGALFFDAAHAWNGKYDFRQTQLRAGETLGSGGFGFRMNLFGGFVLRYDIGYRFRDGFEWEKRPFKQFFFGWDF